MDREIKFRAWDKEDKEMYYGWEGDEYGNGYFEYSHILPVPDDSEFYLIYQSTTEGAYEHSEMRIGEVMQYTGLKDKNGTEIYEGDIIETPLGNITEIRWEKCKESKDGSVYEYTGFVARLDGVNFHLDHTITDGEVIGNIYNNLELIKQ